MFTFEPQKCLHLYKEEEKKKPKLNGLYMESIKLNGWYAYIDFDPRKGWSGIHSSAMREIPAFEKYKEHFEALMPVNCPHRLVAEAIIPGMDFFEMNGLFNRSVGDYHVKGVEFHFHDIILIDEPKEADYRYYYLESYLEDQETDTIKLHKIREIHPYDKELWYSRFNEVVEAGEEGLVFKRTDSVYSPGKRNSDLVKMKMEDTFDVICFRVYWTKGEKGNFNLNMEVRNKAGIITPVRIGKHSDIEAFKDNPPIGQVVEIKAMCKTKYGNYKEPRFVRLRPDKLPKDID